MKPATPWRSLTLGEVLDVENFAIVPESGVSYKYLGLEHIEQQTGRILDPPETDGSSIQSQKYLFTPSHVLYGKLRPNLNKVAIPDFAGVCSTDILPLAVRRNALPEYVAFFLRSPDFVHHAVNRASGTKMPRFGPRQFLQTSIPVPPLPVQERIVQILQKADEINLKRKKALDLADAVLPASFVAMFGDNAHLEHIPLGEVADVRSGVTKGRELGTNNTVEVPYLRVANVQDGFLDLSEIKTIEVLPTDLERYRLEDGDILMTEGGDPDKLGRGAIWRGQVEGCIHQNHVFRVRTDRSKLAPEYLAALMRTQYAKQYFLSCAKRSSNLASVNSTQVKAFPVPLPSIQLQEKFVSAVEQWVQSSQNLAEGLKETGGLSASLVNQAFSGQLTAEWETANAGWIAEQVNVHERLPQLLLLALIRERSRRAENSTQTAILVTALMKYAFLLQMEGNARRRLYRFVPYHYGPFAKQLYDDLQALAQDGVVQVENDQAEEKTRITLVDMAKADALLAALPQDITADIAACVDTYGALDHKNLLKAVYKKYPAYAKRSKLNKKPVAS
jgi:type I restriction enzyme, S subunit